MALNTTENQQDGLTGRLVRLLARTQWIQRYYRVITAQTDFWIQGDPYLSVLERFHERRSRLEPGYRYLEIGTCRFDSLLIARGKVNVGVDPQPNMAFRFNAQEEREYRVNVATSDVFFSSYADAKEHYLLVFVDGLHTFEQTARDVINVLVQNSRADTDILVHDVIPINKWVANPQRSTKFWVGDTYRILPLFKSLGVDFKIILAPPSGLLWVKGSQRAKVEGLLGKTGAFEQRVRQIKEQSPLDTYEIGSFFNEYRGRLVSTRDLDAELRARPAAAATAA